LLAVNHPAQLLLRAAAAAAAAAAAVHHSTVFAWKARFSAETADVQAPSRVTVTPDLHHQPFRSTPTLLLGSAPAPAMSIADWMYNCNVTSLRSLEQKLDGSNSSGYSAVRPQPCVSSRSDAAAPHALPSPPAGCSVLRVCRHQRLLARSLDQAELARSSPPAFCASAHNAVLFCRRTPYLMGKFWVMLKWYLLITFIGSVCGAIGWSFRSTAGGLNYKLSDPILKVRISRARVLRPTTRVIPLSEKAEQG